LLDLEEIKDEDQARRMREANPDAGMFDDFDESDD
jgi:hypothetical protein